MGILILVHEHCWLFFCWRAVIVAGHTGTLLQVLHNLIAAYIDPFSFRSTRGDAAALSFDAYHATDHGTYGLCGIFPRKNLFSTSFCGQIGVKQGQ